MHVLLHLYQSNNKIQFLVPQYLQPEELNFGLPTEQSNWLGQGEQLLTVAVALPLAERDGTLFYRCDCRVCQKVHAAAATPPSVAARGSHCSRRSEILSATTCWVRSLIWFDVNQFLEWHKYFATRWRAHVTVVTTHLGVVCVAEATP